MKGISLLLLILSFTTTAGTITQRKNSNYLKVFCSQYGGNGCSQYGFEKKINGKISKARADSREVPSRFVFMERYCGFRYFCDADETSLVIGTIMGATGPFLLFDNLVLGAVGAVIGTPIGVAIDILKLPVSIPRQIHTALLRKKARRIHDAIVKNKKISIRKRDFKKVLQFFNHLEWN